MQLRVRLERGKLDICVAGGFQILSHRLQRQNRIPRLEGPQKIEMFGLMLIHIRNQLSFGYS